MDNKTEVLKLREKYRQQYVNLDKTGFNASGLFVEATRNKLLDMKDSSGGRQYRFWHKNRKRIKTALIDLQLFLEIANEKNVNQVFNEETLQPFVGALLYRYKYNSTKSKIAQLFIEIGFSYLYHANRGVLTPSQRRAIEDASSLSKQLTFLTLPEEEREKYKIRFRFPLA